MPFYALSDAPASADRDLLDFGRYSDPLISLLSSATLQTPFTLGIFGMWGSGKSTLLEFLFTRLGKPIGGLRFLRVRFNPWMFRKEPNLLIPVLGCLYDALAEDETNNFKESALKIFDVLARLAADTFLKKLTAGAVDIDKLDKLERAYLDRRGQIDNQLRNLRKALSDVAKKLEEQNTRIIFFIDDLDRCDPADIVDVLESMKLFLDLPNIVHILALDKEVIDRGIEVKYGKFDFASTDSGRQKVLGAEYLEKMIQMPVYLYPLHREQVKSYILKLDQSEPVLKHIDLLVAALTPNPRKIKRVLNMLALTTIMMAADPPHYADFDRYIVIALAIMLVQEPPLYLEAARLPGILVALEDVYAGDRNVRNKNSFLDFGAKDDAVRGLCEKFYKPTGTLAAIFDKDNRRFKAVANRLDVYLSLTGGF